LFCDRPDPNNNEITNNQRRVSFNDTALEKEVQDALNGPEVQQQIRASIGSLPGDIQFSQSLRLTRKRSWIRSKMPLRFFFLLILYNNLSFFIIGSFENQKDRVNLPPLVV